MKMFITLVPHGIFCSNFVYLCIFTLSSHLYEKCDEASPSIILAGRALLLTMHITLEPEGIFGSNFVYLCILTLFSHWYEKRLNRASCWQVIIIIIIINSLFLKDDILIKYNYLSNIWSSATKKNILYRHLCIVYTCML